MERLRPMIHTRSITRSMIWEEEMETLRSFVWVVAGLCAAMLWFSHDKMTGAQILWAVGIILVAFGWYALSCWWWPFGACFCCKGKGTHYRKDNKVHRTCRKRLCSWHSPFASCGGKGRRLRWGRRVSNFVREKTAGTLAKTKAKTA